MAAKRIEVEEENRKAVQEKRIIAADSLQKFQLQILELDNNTEVAGELGPLQYLSGLTGTPMDKIINVLLLIIIFVFDPLAIALVVAANFAFDQAYKKTLYDEFEDEDDQGLWEDEEFEDWDPGYEEYLKGTKLKTPQELPDEDEDEIDPPNEALVEAAEQYKERVLLIENNIYQVIHKGPSMWKVELRTGEIVSVPKALAQKYLTQDPESSKSYM
jgi:hypothetical protein